MMNDTPKALNEEVVEPNLDATPVSEETVPEEVVEKEATSAEEAPKETTETEEAPKKGFQARVQELNTKAKAAEARANEAEEKAKSLSDRLEEITGSVEPNQIVEPQVNEPIVSPGEEIDAAELDKRLQAREAKILQRADAIVTLRGKQQEAITRINNEAQSVIRKYAELDPENESFNKELSDTITESTEAYVKQAPYTASVSKFVDRQMKLYKGAVSKEVGQATENIAKQVSEAALRPTSIRKPEKAANEKSIAELEQDLGIVQA